MPVLEAMSLGVPVVAAHRGSLPEVLGDAGPLVDPDDPTTSPTRSRSCWPTTATRRRARSKGLARARAFSWETHRAQRLDVYRQALAHRAERGRRALMRIGIDARELCGHRHRRRPLSRRAAARMGGDCAGAHEFVLYAPDAIDAAARRAPVRDAHRAGAAGHLVGAGPRCRARQPPITSTSGLRRLHRAAPHARPDRRRDPRPVVRRPPRVVPHARRRAAALADASQSARERVSGRHDLRVLEARARRAAQRAAGRVHVIPPGIGPGGSARVARPASSPTPAPSPQSPAPAPRVLFVGSIFNRRHVVDLIRAFAPIARAHPDASLDIVGDNRSYPQAGSAPDDCRRSASRVRCAGMSTSTDERARAISTRSARAFAFLSEYEGLGLTPLEALAAGVPPVLLDTPVARESCGDAAVYVPLRRRARDHARARRGAVRRGDTLANSRRRAGRARAIQLAARRARDAGGARRRRVGRRTSRRRDGRSGRRDRPMDRLSIIIVSFNARADLERCLDVAARGAARDRARDRRRRQRIDRRQRSRPRAAGRMSRVIEVGANVGFAAGNNAGIRASTGDAICCC